MSGDVERPPARPKGREHRNGKWKKCFYGAGGRGSEKGEGESNEQEENKAGKWTKGE